MSRNLEPLRGLRQALQAWPLVLEQWPDAELLLVGSTNPNGYGLQVPQAATHLEDAVEELPPDIDRSSIHVLGVLDHADLVTLLQCSACHLAMSYPYTLSWSNSRQWRAGLHHHQLGSALSHELKDNENSLLCSFADVRGLAELILELLNSPQLQHHIGTGGMALVQQRFSQEVALERFETLAEKLIDVSKR